MTTIRLTLIGDAGCGKTTYMNRFITGDFTKEYHHNESSITSSFDYQTTCGQITFKIKETTRLSSKCMNGYLVMYDITSKESFEKSMKYIQEIKTKFPGKPVVHLANKVDLNVNRFVPKQHLKTQTQYYMISARSMYNFEEGFLYLSRIHFNDPDLLFLVETDEPDKKYDIIKPRLIKFKVHE